VNKNKTKQNKIKQNKGKDPLTGHLRLISLEVFDQLLINSFFPIFPLEGKISFEGFPDNKEFIVLSTLSGIFSF